MTWVPRSTYSRGRVMLKVASGNCTSYVAANINARALGRYLRRSTVLRLPAKAQQNVLRRPENTPRPKGRGMPDPAHTSVPDPPRGGEDFWAASLNLRLGLAGKVAALGSFLRGWGYPDVLGLQEVGKLPVHIVAHAMHWAAFTQAAHLAAGVGILIRWHPTLFWRWGETPIPVGEALPWRIGAAGGASWLWWSISP